MVVANRCVQHWSGNAFAYFLLVCFLLVCFLVARFVGFFSFGAVARRHAVWELSSVGRSYRRPRPIYRAASAWRLGRWVWATEGDFLALAPTTFVLTEKRNLLLLRAVHAELYQGREADEAALAHYEA